MREVREQVRADLHARLITAGAADDFDSRAVFDEVDRLLAQALAHGDPKALLIPALLPDPWRPALSLDFTGHRGGVAARAIRAAKARLVLPVVRWLYEVQRRELPPPAAGQRRAHGLPADARRRPRPPQGPRREPRAPPRRMTLLFVVQRYGADITGGSEYHCRAVAQHLAARGHAVSVATTCATDYITWANRLPAGRSQDGAVGVHRFEVARERPLGAFWR